MQFQEGVYQHQQGYPPGGFQRDTPSQPEQADDFHFELSSCGDDSIACTQGFCCPYFQISAQFKRTEHNNTGTFSPVCVGIVCLQCVGNMIVRGKIRARYNIEPSCFDDLCASFFCFWCAVTQQYRELVFHGAWPGGICAGTPPPRQADPMGLETNMMQL